MNITYKVVLHKRDGSNFIYSEAYTDKNYPMTIRTRKFNLPVICDESSPTKCYTAVDTRYEFVFELPWGPDTILIYKE